MDAVFYAKLKDLASKHRYCIDFMVDNSSANDFYGGALASGTKAVSTSSALHPGVRLFTSSTSANSGYYCRTDQTALLLGGREKATLIFFTPPGFTNNTVRFGFHDSITEAAPTDGVYCLMAANVLTGQTMNNTTGSTTGTSYTLAAGTWYRIVVKLNADASLATFTLYADNSNTVLWTDTLATNIPTGAGRFVGFGLIGTNSGTTAVPIVSVDYMDMSLPSARRV